MARVSSFGGGYRGYSGGEVVSEGTETPFKSPTSRLTEHQSLVFGSDGHPSRSGRGPSRFRRVAVRHRLAPGRGDSISKGGRLGTSGFKGNSGTSSMTDRRGRDFLRLTPRKPEPRGSTPRPRPRRVKRPSHAYSISRPTMEKGRRSSSVPEHLSRSSRPKRTGVNFGTLRVGPNELQVPSLGP